jgi:hypothetical protein
MYQRTPDGSTKNSIIGTHHLTCDGTFTVGDYVYQINRRKTTNGKGKPSLYLTIVFPRYRYVSSIWSDGKGHLHFDDKQSFYRLTINDDSIRVDTGERMAKYNQKRIADHRVSADERASKYVPKRTAPTTLPTAVYPSLIAPPTVSNGTGDRQGLLFGNYERS